MENNENLLERNEVNEVENADYIAAINELKKNSVDKAKYDKLREENKMLLGSLINGEGYKPSEAEAPKPDIKTLRDKVFNNPDQTNLEYITNVLALRDALLEAGEEDPFVPQGEKIAATAADYERANKVATVFQEMVDAADGDPNVFLNEYQRRVKDTSIKKK